VGKSAARHPTNRHLSAHRAIAVARALEQGGVPGDRIMIAGWGEYRPTAPNNPRGGTPANRRVEIYLVASTGDMGMSVDAMSAEEAAPAEDRRRAPMK
jgi:flagellar motor protein MotB